MSILFLVIALLALFAPFILFTACDSRTSEATKAKSPTAEGLLQAFKHSGLPVVNEITYTKETDPDGVLSKQGHYYEKIGFSDSRFTSEATSRINTIEVFKKKSHMEKRRDYIEKLSKSTALSGGDYYIYDNNLFLLLIPKSTTQEVAEQYKVVFEAYLSGKEIPKIEIPEIVAPPPPEPEPEHTFTPPKKLEYIQKESYGVKYVYPNNWELEEDIYSVFMRYYENNKIVGSVVLNKPTKQEPTEYIPVEELREGILKLHIQLKHGDVKDLKIDTIDDLNCDATAAKYVAKINDTWYTSSSVILIDNNSALIVDMYMNPDSDAFLEQYVQFMKTVLIVGELQI